MKRGLGIALFCICFCALLLVCALWRGLTLRFYRLETDKLTEDARLRLVLLTDLHSAVYGEGHRELLDLVLDQRRTSSFWVAISSMTWRRWKRPVLLRGSFPHRRPRLLCLRQPRPLAAGL